MRTKIDRKSILRRVDPLKIPLLVQIDNSFEYKMNSIHRTSPELFPVLKSDEVHIWSAYLPNNKKNISYFSSVLSPGEYQRAGNYRFSKDREDFIVSRGILRSLLGKYMQQDPQKINIVYGLCGKPCLVDHPLHFNLSHSKDYVLYALTRKYEVGIDLEYMDPSLDLEAIALNIFSPQTLTSWKSIKAEERLNTFFKLWVCKEAFLKTLGKGWLDEQNKICLTELAPLKNDNQNSEGTKKMIAPCCIDYIPSYASALFIKGPVLDLFFYTFERSTIHMK